MLITHVSKYKLAGITHFKWDPFKKGQGIQIYNNGESLFLNESCYAFRSIVSNQVIIKLLSHFILEFITGK